MLHVMTDLSRIYKRTRYDGSPPVLFPLSQLKRSHSYSSPRLWFTEDVFASLSLSLYFMLCYVILFIFLSSFLLLFFHSLLFFIYFFVVSFVVSSFVLGRKADRCSMKARSDVSRTILC